MDKYDVFISYSRKDSDVAERICRAFDKAGISYFIDKQGICGGMEFPLVLADAICDSRLFLFLASENSYSSKFSNNEITFAFNEKPKESILPYIIDESQLPRQMRFIFAGINWRNIKEHPVESVLIEDLRQLLRIEDKESSQKEQHLYSPDSKDVSVCYEENGCMYFCIAGSGRKIKVDMQNYNLLSQKDILKRIEVLTITDLDKSKGSETPGLDYINANFDKLKKRLGLLLSRRIIQNHLRKHTGSRNRFLKQVILNVV